MEYIKNKVSVIVLTYNHIGFIRQAIESVQQQEIQDMEIIVADDHSQDGTLDIIKEMAVVDKRIRPLLSETNTGISNNLNRGLKSVTGEFVATLAGDDMMLHGKLKKQMEYMRNNPDCGICCHDAEVFDSTTGAVLYRFNERFVTPKNIEENLFFTNWFFRKKEVKLTSSSNFARSTYYLQNLYDPRFVYTNEMLHGIMNYAKSPKDKLGFINEVLSRYRMHSHNITGKQRSFESSLEEYQMLLSVVAAKYPETYDETRNFVGFHIFKSILYKEVPLEKRSLYENVFLKQFGILKYIYLKICELYLALKGM